RFDAPLAIAMIASAQPEIASLYQPLANMFLLLALDAASASVDDPGVTASRPKWLPSASTLAGFWCGLAFLAKHTIGVYAAIATTAVFIVLGPRPRNWFRDVRAIADAMGTGLVVVVLGLAPIATTGGWHFFVDYAFVGKGTYLSVAGVAYLEELRTFGRALISGTPAGAVQCAKSLALVVPVVSIAAVMVLARFRRSHPRVFWMGIVIVLAEFVGLYPRADVAHVIPVVPGLLVVILLAWHVLGDQRGSAMQVLRGLATMATAVDIVGSFRAAGSHLSA